MKRISPVLFLTAAATMFLSDQTSFAQSSDMAPGPIAELLPEFDTTANGGFNSLDAGRALNRFSAPNRQVQQTDSGENRLPEVNALPTATSQGSADARFVGNALPLFDTPARPRSSSASINSAPPAMPSAAVLVPRSPGSFYPGSTPVGTGQFSAGHAPVPSAASLTPSSIDQSCGCQSAMVVSEGDCGCDTCAEGEIITTNDCDSCNSSEEFFYLDEIGSGSIDECNASEYSQCEDGFYDTGADRIDGKSSQHTSTRRGRTGILGRHRARHLARKESRAKNYQGEEEFYDEDVYGQDQACAIEDYNGTDPAVAPVSPAPVNKSAVNTTIGLSGLYFNRNYEDDRQFSASRFVNERGLFSNDADEDNFGGYEAYLTRRKANGNGFEARYFDLEPSRATATLSGGPLTSLSGGGVFNAPQYLSGVGVQGANSGADVSAAEVFNFADVHQVVRETEIQNVEFNLLRLGRTAQRSHGEGRQVSHEYLFGFRYFRFDESFNYNAQAFRQGNIASGLSRADYLNEVTNTLFGLQIGRRSEIGFLKRFSLIAVTKAGVFNNDFTNNQTVNFSPRGAGVVTAQVLNGASSGQPFDTQGNGSAVTMLGELDLGVACQISRNSRLRVGYRALFVPNLAFAVPQTETFFTDLNAVQNPTDNDDLFLQGGYFGAEFAF